MAQLFIENTRVGDFGEVEDQPGTGTGVGTGTRWSLVALAAKAYSLVGRQPTLLRPKALRNGSAATRTRGPLLLRCQTKGACESWVLIPGTNTPVWVNGVRPGAGARVLEHRDELRISGCSARAYFSSEELPTVTAFDGVEGSVCPRCRKAIERGNQAVRCSRCGVWHHEQSQAGGLACWSYDPHCAACGHESPLDGELEWVPEEGTPLG